MASSPSFLSFFYCIMFSHIYPAWVDEKEDKVSRKSNALTVSWKIEEEVGRKVRESAFQIKGHQG